MVLCTVFVANVWLQRLPIYKNCHLLSCRKTNEWYCQLIRFKNKRCQNKKTVPHFLFPEGQMHLYPVYFHATDLLYITEHPCNKIYRYFNFRLCIYHLSSAVLNVTLNIVHFISDMLVLMFLQFKK